MKTIDLTPITSEEISIDQFLKLKESGNIRGIKIEGIVPPQLGREGGFGMIRIQRDTPIYRPL